MLLLVALAAEGNIHRAAQVLNITPPAASKLLKDLEDVVEVLLFDRYRAACDDLAGANHD